MPAPPAPEPFAKVFTTMSSQKRQVLFVVLSIILMVGIQVLMDRLGLNPPPPPPKPAPAPAPVDPAIAQQAAPAVDPARPAAAPAQPGAMAQAPTPAKKPEPPEVKPGELVLGSTDNTDPSAYRIEVRLDQRGAAVRQLRSARFDGETIDGIPDRKARLQLIQDDPLSKAPKPFAITLVPAGRPIDPAFPNGEVPLDTVRWEVVRDGPDAPAVRTVRKPGPGGAGEVEGQEIAFRTTADNPNVTVTKRFRLWKGEDGFEYELTFGSDADATVAYRLFGPHGIPIEGESYTTTFRDVFFGQLKGGATEIVTRSAADVVKSTKGTPETFTTLPLRFAGVENQYFTVFVEPSPIPTSQEGRIDRESLALLAREDVKAPQKSDVGVQILSTEIGVGPNRPATHAFKVYAGPKSFDALAPYAATDLASYRKNWFSIPFATTLAQNVIAPLLNKIYALTEQIARMFGFKAGSYGVAIILLTMTVRMIMFPLGRKQAMISKKMQDLQPHLAALKEKYKDDKERQTKETFALYKEHGFNPAAGCLPALIQLPIFVGLWQALNNSVALRHSRFLYIQNLAAPDMLFNFGTELPLSIGHYFNLLPFVVVSLMLVQTKLFTPPAMTEEAKMQQKMMKYMMIFMAFMFYRVPSGLGIYFITSSLWQICERLLLPKITKTKPMIQGTDRGTDRGPGGDGMPGGPGPKSGGGAGGWLAKKLEKLMEEAENQRTIRNNGGVAPRSNGGPPDRTRNRPRPGKRR